VGLNNEENIGSISLKQSSLVKDARDVIVKPKTAGTTRSSPVRKAKPQTGIRRSINNNAINNNDVMKVIRFQGNS